MKTCFRKKKRRPKEEGKSNLRAKWRFSPRRNDEEMIERRVKKSSQKIKKIRVIKTITKVEIEGKNSRKPWLENNSKSSKIVRKSATWNEWKSHQEKICQKAEK